jgi:hypothetical protein
MDKSNEEITAFSIPLKSATIPNEVAQRNTAKDTNLDYIPFGSDNLFPQVWELQMRNSVVSRSILKDKVTYTMGDGLDFSDNKQLENYSLEVNSLGQSLEDIMHLVYRDKYSGGNGYVEVVKHKGFVSFFHKDWTECRVSKGGKTILVHPDWADYENNKKKIVEIPLYPNFETVKASQEENAEDLQGERSIIHLKNYEAEFNYYGLPDAIAAKNAIAVGYSTTGWNKSRIENGMNVSGILLLSGKYSDEQAKNAKKKVEEEFTGEDNQGKVLAIVKESGTDGRTENTEFVQVGTQSDGDWLNLSNEAKGEILMAWNWKRTLTSFDDSTGMNNSDKILNDYYVALSTVIKPEQRIVLGKFIQVISVHSKYDGTDITHINKPPVPLFMVVKNGDSAFKKGEVRESAGLEWDKEDEKHNEYLNDKQNGTNNTN